MKNYILGEKKCKFILQFLYLRVDAEKKIQLNIPDGIDDILTPIELAIFILIVRSIGKQLTLASNRWFRANLPFQSVHERFHHNGISTSKDDATVIFNLSLLNLIRCVLKYNVQTEIVLLCQPKVNTRSFTRHNVDDVKITYTLTERIVKAFFFFVFFL